MHRKKKEPDRPTKSENARMVTLQGKKLVLLVNPVNGKVKWGAKNPANAGGWSFWLTEGPERLRGRRKSEIEVRPRSKMKRSVRPIVGQIRSQPDDIIVAGEGLGEGVGKRRGNPKGKLVLGHVKRKGRALSCRHPGISRIGDVKREGAATVGRKSTDAGLKMGGGPLSYPLKIMY